MPSPLSGFGPLTGPGSTRRLGTEAGALRREARKVRRAGGDDRRLLEASGLSGMRDGSISSADSNIEEASFNRRAAAGLGAARQGVLREMAGQGGGMSGGAPATGMGTGSAAVPPPTTGAGTGAKTPPTTGAGTGTKTPPTTGTGTGTGTETPPTTGAGTGAGAGAGTGTGTSGGRTPIAGKSLKPTAEESASDDRRYNARQGVLRDVMAKASESGKTRREVLDFENEVRKIQGKPALSFEDDEFVTESERQKAPALEADRTRRRGIREGMIDMELTGRDVADEAAAAQRRAAADARTTQRRAVLQESLPESVAAPAVSPPRSDAPRFRNRGKNAKGVDVIAKDALKSLGRRMTSSDFSSRGNR